MAQNDGWQIFLTNVRDLCDEKLRSQPDVFPPGDTIELLDEILSALSREENILGIIEGTEDVGHFLIREIELFNQSVEEERAAERYDGPEGQRFLALRLEQAKTIKESIEEHVDRLPGWAKKVLSVLNELLSLVGV